MQAQNTPDSFTKLWKEVAALEKEQMTKSANEKVGFIYQKAVAEKNVPQKIKSLLYQSKYALVLKEEATLQVINNFKEEIAQADFPEKNILNSLLAQVYWQYYRQNQWRFMERTHTEEKVDAEDFRTWDLQTIMQEIHLHFENSLENAFLAQQKPLKNFDELLVTEENSKKYRPTLYDFLAQNALEFYKTDVPNSVQAFEKFEIDNPGLLKDNKTFISTEISSKDSLSHSKEALDIYKNLTTFHLKNKYPEALVTLTLDRLDYVRQKATFENKDELYLHTLKELKDKWYNTPLRTEIDYRLAIEYQTKAAEYQSGKKEQNRFMLLESIKVCKQAITGFPDSNGAKKCKNLLNRIKAPTISLTNESSVQPDQANKLLVTYKNVAHLYFKIYEVGPQIEENIRQKYNKKEKLTYIKKFKEITAFHSALRNEGDYQMHSTEVIMPALSQGMYLILTAPDADFNDDNNYAFSFVQATSLALVENQFENTYRYQVVDRMTGAPVHDAKVHLKNKNTRYSNKPIDKTYYTDEQGFVSHTPKAYHNQIEIEVTYQDRKGLFRYYRMYDRNGYDYHQEDAERVFLFTDRSIYRPGQTVYFKGIALRQFENKSVVIENQKVSVKLLDVNYQELASMDAETNEYGSFDGTFVLPDTGLTGRFQINVQGKGTINKNYNSRLNGSVFFQVEEYKRPKFYVEFDSIKQSLRINDSVKIKAKAMAYAGSSISDAQVVYRVKRQVQYPRWWYWYNPYFVSAEAQEIAHGVTETQADGSFEIPFLAKPDKSVDPENKPVFSYEITAEVTDINGETRSATQIVRIGYHSLELSLKTDEKWNKDETNTLRVLAKNLNGKEMPVEGSLEIFKLKAPEGVYRPRLWQIPDYQDISKEKYQQLFPYESYALLTDMDKTKGKSYYNTTFDTNKHNEISIKKMNKWPSGAYLVEVKSKDPYGQEIKDLQVITISAPDDKQASDNKFFSITLDKDQYQPNALAYLVLESAAKDMHVLIEVEKNHKIIETKIIHLDNEIKRVPEKVTKEDYGGFAIKYHLVYANAFLSGNIMVSVPYPKTDLQIETLHFKDKLQPAEEQTWSFKIKGAKNEKVAAEVLASMYDKSLDQFLPHSWSFNPVNYQYYYSRSSSNGHNSFGNKNFTVYTPKIINLPVYNQQYDRMNWFGFSLGYGHMLYGVGQSVENELGRALSGRVKGVVVSAKTEAPEAEAAPMMDESVVEEDVAYAMHTDKYFEKSNKVNNKPETDFSQISVRTDFNETAFFYPTLRTDAEGNISFEFTMPESLTSWKLQLLAHNKQAHYAIETLETQTQKELMILPNMPRFLREGDEIVISTKISNLTKKTLNGVAELQLFDALTNKSIDVELSNTEKTQSFSVNEEGNTQVSWRLQIPDGIQAVQYKILAKAAKYSDGEQNILPVLTNRMLVTETLPMWVSADETRTYTLNKLLNQESKTAVNHRLTLEVTSNPVWYAVQSLPYLMEYPYECSEQTFARYYANTLAAHIANSNPRIQEVFKQWKNTESLMSNLEKNQELKSLIIEETPWVRDAKSETEQKKRIALLFDLNKMSNEEAKAIRKLEQLQMSSGGFPWFKGSRYPNRFITQYIVAGFGHFAKLGVTSEKNQQTAKLMMQKAVGYLDEEIVKDYKELLKQAHIIEERENDKAKGKILAKEFLAQNHTSARTIYQLYARNFFQDIKIPSSTQLAMKYYTDQAYQYWADYPLYTKALISLVAHTNGNTFLAQKLIRSIKENSIYNEELGMYWKENEAGMYWNQAPIETQALLIEAFDEVAQDTESINRMKIWLLKNKQTNRWKTTKATSEAIYALLLQGTDWLQNTDFVNIKIGDQVIDPMRLEDTKVEAGTGYFKKAWHTTEIKPGMAKLRLTNDGNSIAWGALYWQYFEDLDKITPAETPLKLDKKLFLKKYTDRGEAIEKIDDRTELKPGDLIRVRIELKVDRPMEFVHMKDMRASGLEPVNVLSQYKWQDGLGYYESTKDAATNFFMDYLPKGVYVFEYDLRVAQQGDFSNGITTIQCMYAPEFSSHSEGVRLKVNN